VMANNGLSRPGVTLLSERSPLSPRVDMTPTTTTTTDGSFWAKAGHCLSFPLLSAAMPWGYDSATRPRSVTPCVQIANMMPFTSEYWASWPFV